jgi:hypothetical protein
MGVDGMWPDDEASPLAVAWEEAERSEEVRRTGIEGEPAPEPWDEWLPALFPAYVRGGFAARHGEFWDWVWDIEPASAPRPFVAIWPRGGGKSTSAELAAAALGVRGKRRYCLYVRETQENADKSVGNIAALLESDAVERHYPPHAEKKVGKFGESKGWRRERLRTAGGLTIDAIGLDTAARGVKVEDQRPDLIILDDIDGKHDSAATTAKKISTITSSILPAGATNVAVLAIQNLIIPDGVFTRMVDGRADYLATRIVSGPYPAVDDMQTELVEDEETGTRRAIIVGGTATWEGQSLAVCQDQVDLFGLSSFLKECQHEVQDTREGRALRYDATRHRKDLTDDECRALVALGQAFAGLDFGDWRFGFVLRASDVAGRLHQIGEYFSQRESLEHRARVITCICAHYGITGRIPMRGDAANPQDIRELNLAFKRIASRLVVHAVTNENKSRRTAVERENDLLERDALFYRRGVASHMQTAVNAEWERREYPGDPPDVRHWRLGYNTTSAGTEMEGSRLQWEAEHWSYPIPKEGEAQRQDPDDHTADGADLIAADRYAIMSHLRPGREKQEEEKRQPNVDPHWDEFARKAKERERNEERRKRAEERRVQRVLKQIRKGKR